MSMPRESYAFFFFFLFSFILRLFLSLFLPVHFFGYEYPPYSHIGMFFSIYLLFFMLFGLS